MFQFLTDAAAKFRGQSSLVRRRSRRPLTVEWLEERCLLAGTADLRWSTFLGGTGYHDSPEELAVDERGDIYVAGPTTSPDFPVSPGAFDSTLGGDGDAFVAKISADGARVLWATYLGGLGGESASDLAYDAASEALYVVGNTSSSDFPVIEGAAGRLENDRSDGFVVKMSAGDGQVLWSTLGQYEGIRALTLGPDGSIYVVGATTRSQFTTNAGVVMRQSNTSNTAFVARVSSYDRTILNAAFINDPLPAVGYGSFAKDVAVDAMGSVYVTGQTTTGGVSVTKWPADLREQLWRTDLEGSFFEEPAAIVLDGPQSGVVFGQTRSRDFPVTSGAYATTHAGGLDLFVTKFATGTGMVSWSTFIGGVWNDYASDIDVSPRGLVLCGDTGPSGYPTTPDAYEGTYNGSSDVMVSWLSSQGDALVYSTYLGGQGRDECRGVRADAAGGVFVVGHTQSSDFPVSPGAYDQTRNGSSFGFDGFVAYLLPEFALTSDLVGPHVTAVGPTSPVPGPVNFVDVTFNEPIDGATFTVQDVVLTNPNGSPVRVLRVQEIAPTVFRVKVFRQRLLGEYRLIIGPDIRDLEGNLMDQDSDGQPGEPLEDRFTGVFEIVPRTFVFFFSGYGGPFCQEGISGMSRLRDRVAFELTLSNNVVVAAPALDWPSGLICLPSLSAIRRQVARAQNHIRSVLLREQATPFDRVVLIGHSYGGNIAYNLAPDARPDLPGRQPAYGLVTLDPIDWSLCRLQFINICPQASQQRLAPKGVPLANILNFVQRNPRPEVPLPPVLPFQALQGFTILGAINEERGRGADGRWGTLLNLSPDDTRHGWIDDDFGPGADGQPGGGDDVSLGIFDTIVDFLQGIVVT